MEFELVKLSNTMSEMHIKFPVDVFNEELSKLTPSRLKDVDPKPILNPSANRVIGIPHGSRGTTTSPVRVASVVSTTHKGAADAQNACTSLTIGGRALKDKLVSVSPKASVEAVSTVLPYIGINVVERNKRASRTLDVTVSSDTLSMRSCGSPVLKNILDGTESPKGGRLARASVRATTPFIRYEHMGVCNPCSASSVLYNNGLASAYSAYYDGGRVNGAALMSTILSSEEAAVAAQTQGNIFYVPKSVARIVGTGPIEDDNVAKTKWGSLRNVAHAIKSKRPPTDYYRGRNNAVYGAYADNILAGKSSQGVYNRLSSLPIVGMCSGFVMFINIIDGTKKFMPLPSTLDMTTIITNDELGDAFMAMVAEMTEDDIRLAFEAFKSIPVSDLKPSSLRPDTYKGDIVEFLASPVVMSMVKTIHRGWCYSDPASADKEFMANPPMQYRGEDMGKQQASLVAVRNYTRFKSMLATAAVGK